MIFGFIVIVCLGWLTGMLTNHLANALPLKETPWQLPFCKRRVDGAAQEFISTAVKGEDKSARAAPVYCHARRPRAAWSAVIAYASGNQNCTACGKSMRLRSLLVELATPVFFLILFQRYPLSIYLIFILLYTAILILLTVTDLEYRLIQNVVILPAILLAIAGGFFTPHFGWQRAIVGGAVGFVVFYILAIVARGSLGEGDVTLAAFLGLITGLPNVLLVIFYGILLGGLVSVILIAARQVTLKTFIPYGPFLIVSGWVVLVWGTELWAWILR